MAATSPNPATKTAIKAYAQSNIGAKIAAFACRIYGAKDKRRN